MTDCASPNVGIDNLLTCESSTADHWRGLYEVDDTMGACRAGNPYSSNTCTCPPGTAVFTGMPIFSGLSGALGIPGHLQFCLGPTPSSLGNFGGMYLQLDAPCSAGPTCQTANPLRGACSCPAGFGKRQYRALTPCPNGPIGANLYFCYRP